MVFEVSGSIADLYFQFRLSVFTIIEIIGILEAIISYFVTLDRRVIKGRIKTKMCKL